jgi:hypothetical protein
MPRIKHVFTNRQCAHIFAQQNQDWGRGSSNSFQGDTFRSYATPVARVVISPETRARVLLVSAYKYSNTTARHLSDLSRAWHNHGPEFDVISLGVTGGRHYRDTNGEPDHASNLAYLVDRVAREAKRIAKAVLYRSRGTMDLYAGYATRYANLFRLDPPDFGAIIAELDAVEAKRAKRDALPSAIRRRANREAERERERARRAEREKARWEALRLAQAENVEKWMQGDPNVYIRYYTFDDGSAVLRIKPGNPDRVQTSQGAEVSVTSARHLLAVVRGVRARGEAWMPAPNEVFPVGNFTLNSIDAEGNARVGCHKLTWIEIDRFATAQGW